MQSLDFTEFQDTLDLDAALTLNQTTNTWTQSFTGTTTTGFAYTATSLTTGSALNVTTTNTATTNTALSPVQFNLTNAQSTTANTNGVTGLAVNFTNNPSVAGNTEYALRIQNQLTANVTDNAVSALLLLDNADSTATGTTIVTDAIAITNSGGSNFTNFLNTPTLDISAAGAITGATGITSSGSITFSAFTSNGGPLYTNGSGVIAQTTAGTATQVLHGGTAPSFSAVSLTTDVSGTLPVGNGGTGATTFTANGVLYGNTTGAVQVTAAGTNGQLLLGVTAGAPVFATMSTDATITNAGVLTIAANAVALTTDTTGNYVANVANGNGIAGGSAGSEGAALTLAIDLLDVDDSVGSITSNSGLEFQGAGSNELTLLQGCANLEVLAWDDTTMEWECTAISGTGVVTGSGTTGQVTYWSGTTTLTGENQLAPLRGGTGINGSAAANGTLLIGNGTGYTLATLTDGTGVTITEGAGSITIASTLGTTIAAAEVDADALDFTEFQDTLDLDAALTLNQTTNTWTQSFTGTTTTGFAYTATSLTTGSALNVTTTNTATANTALSPVQFNLTNAQSTAANTNGVTGLAVNFTNNPSVAGNTEYALRIQNQLTANVTDNAVSALLLLDNADSTATGTTIVTDAIAITNSGGSNFTNFLNTPTLDISAAGAITGATGITSSGNITFSSLTANSFLYSGTGGLLTTTTAPTNGQLLIGSTGVAPVAAALTQGTGITVTNGAGSITIASTLGTTIAAAEVDADSLDFTEFQDTLDLDADLTLNQTTNTWSQSFTGTTTTGFAYTATSLTTGSALNVTTTNTATANTALSPVQFNLTNAQSTLANTAGINGVQVNFTNNPSIAGNTENAVRIQNQLTANVTDNAVSSLLLLDNADTTAAGSTVVTDALRITNSGAIAAGITNGITFASATIDTGINFSAAPTTNILNTPSIDISTAGAITGATGLPLRVPSPSLVSPQPVSSPTPAGGVLGTTTAVAATLGGTGFSSYAVGDLLYANTTTSLAKLAAVASGSCLVSAGVGVAPTWGTCDPSGDSFTTSAGVITKSPLSDRFSLQYGDAADIQLTIENTTNAVIPTVDAMQIDLSGGTTGIVTDGVDGLVITTEFGNGTANTNSALRLSVIPVNTPSGDETFFALNIDALAAGTSATK